MDEIPAFSRRHTPRHSVHVASGHQATVDYTRDDVVLLSARDRLEELVSARNGAASAAEAPRSSSKTRKPVLVPPSSSATIVKAVAGHAPASRKMSGTQLRVFFLLCVAMYFAVICFADDIVAFAQWIGDDDNAAAWKAAIAATPTPSKVDMGAWVPRGHDTARDGGGKSVSTTVETTKKSNLRGEEAMTNVVATDAPAETVTTAKPVEAETPAVLVKKETEATGIVPTTPAPTNVEADEKKASESTGKAPEAPKATEAKAVADKREEDDELTKVAIKNSDEQHVVDDTANELVDDAEHKLVDDDQDAPLDSAEERERESRVEKAVENKSTTEATPITADEPLAAPAEVPKATAPAESAKPQLKPQAGEQGTDVAVTTQPVRNDDGAKNPDAR